MKQPCLKKGEHELKVPLFKGDLGGSRTMQLHIKLGSAQISPNIRSRKFNKFSTS